jgi:hypothetical protein
MGEFQVCCERDGDSVELIVNHNSGMNDNGEIVLLGAKSEEAVAVIDGLIAGLQKARNLLVSE